MQAAKFSYQRLAARQVLRGRDAGSIDITQIVSRLSQLRSLDLAVGPREHHPDLPLDTEGSAGS